MSSDSEALDPHAFESSSNGNESDPDEEHDVSSGEENDAVNDAQDLNSDEIHKDEAQTKSGENGSSPQRETAFDSVSTPALEEAKSIFLKKSSAKKSPAKTPSAKKSPASDEKSSASRKKAGKPSYLDMAHDAIAALKDRTGSSVPAIQKWVKATYPHFETVKPDLFKNSLNKAIQQGVKDSRFVKVKNSFKVNPEWTKKQKAAAKAKEAAKKRADQKRKQEAEKAKAMAKAKKQEEESKKQAEEERRRKDAEKTPEQKAAEAKAKLRADILRKRRYPMEDTQLHEENKEYGIKAPENVTRRPALPYTLTCLVPPYLRGDNPKWGAVFNASMSGTGELMELDNDRGLIVDALHVYHFFCGDVGFADEKYPVPKFSIKTLLYAIDEIILGNSKAAKALPPLISHLFLTALKVLTSPETSMGDSESTDIDPIQAQLQKDLNKLGNGLNAVSWSQILFFYVDLMERYYTSDASLDNGVMPEEYDLDMSYLWNKGSTIDHVAVCPSENGKADAAWAKRYRGYIGNPKGILSKAYTKLGNQIEPWNLTAEELMTLLRVLTDDILSRRADLAADITERGMKLVELQKAKNQAFNKFRKARLDFEGPKKQVSKKRNEGDDDVKESDDGQVHEEMEAGSEKASNDTPLNPKAKKAFLAAEKAYNKSIEAFDNGIRKLVSRTEPIGFDRNFNSYYCFLHDPDMMHVEQLKHSALPPELKRLGLPLNPSSSWHFIDTKSLFDQFLSSLDTRGIRENELYSVSSNLTILKRRLQDEKKDNTRAAARVREKEALERRLENARTACDGEEGRRSGRLAGQAIDEVRKLEIELEQLTKAHGEEEQLEKLGRERACDYSLLTGLQMVTDLDSNKHAASSLEDVSCHKLWMHKKNGGNGTIQVVVDALLEMEDRCNELSPWRREDITRDVWRRQLSDACTRWAKECVMSLGPSCDESPKERSGKDDENEGPAPVKKQRLDDKPFMASIASTIRKCLKELELRLFELSGEKMAFEEADAAEDLAASDDGAVEEIKRRQCWKRKINALKQIPSSRYGIIRDIIVAAVTVARKSHLNQVAAELKLALQLHRPQAAAEAKSAALGVLEKYGGYNEVENEDDDMDLDEIAAVNVGDKKTSEEVEPVISSFLCDEVTMMTGSIGGNQDADQYDWRDVLKTCKSISRLAAATQFFATKADDVIYRVQEEKDALDLFLGLGLAKKQGKSKTSKKKFDLSSPVWADCKVTDELLKGKVKDYPWWPARICQPYDPSLAQSLSDSGFTLISFVGESINYLVSETNVRSFLDDVDENMEQYDADTIAKLNESTAMAKSIWKRQNRGVASPWSKLSKPGFSEEKKSEQ
ncbi:hypothetical protein ACHAWX_007527 [Stephanocyclus meneghinianus]